MLRRSGSRALAHASGMLRAQQSGQQQLAGAGGTLSSQGDAPGAPLGALCHPGAASASAAAAAMLLQSRSKWWWSRSAPGGAEGAAGEGAAAAGPEILLGSDEQQQQPPTDSFGGGAGSGGASGGAGASAATAAGGAGGAGESAADVCEAASAVVDATGAAEAAAFAAAKADVWFGTRAFVDLLETAHVDMAMPWWEAIFVSNLVVRLATFPVTILTQKKSGRMAELRGHSQHMQTLYQQASKATTLAEYERLQAQIAGAQNTLRTKYGKDAKWALIMPGVALANMAVFISQFSAISTLAQEQVPSMATEGLAWFTDLTLPDPYWGLPVLCAAMTLAMVESGALSAEMGQAQTAKTLKWVMRAFALVFIPAGGYVPAAVGLLWFSNSVLSLGQAALLRSKAARRALGLPDIAAMTAAAAGAAGADGGAASPLAARLQQLMGPAAGGGGGAAAGPGPAAAAAAAGASKAGVGAGAAAPPPPGTRPSRLVTSKPAGWKHRKS